MASKKKTAKDRSDPQGYYVAVTDLGPGKGYGIRVMKNGTPVSGSETIVKYKSEVQRAVRELLRWVDKVGSPSEMASASRDRWARKTHWKKED